jgi:hypothetical protein
MMRRVSERFGEGDARWYVHGDVLDVDRFVFDVKAASVSEQPVYIATTAFALLQVLDEVESAGVRSLPLPAGSRIMETGGFKGRTRVVSRAELYERACAVFELAPDRIFAEYGMTELTSQYYDVTFPPDLAAARIKASPPWLRPRVVGPNGKSLPGGTVGALVHVDLANVSSCVAIQTEDLGAAFDDGIVLLGREAGAELRGCSLDAEMLGRVRA